MDRYSIRLVQDMENFLSLRGSWNSLLDRSVNKSLFLCWEWLFSWWQAFAQPDYKLCILLVEQNGILVAIAPFVVRRIKWYGLSRLVLGFIGEGAADRSDVISESTDPGLFTALFDYIQNDIEWDIFYVREVSESSPFFAWLQTKHTPLYMEPDSSCPYLPYAPGMNREVFEQSLSYKMRSELRNVRNRLRSCGTVSFDHVHLKNYQDPIVAKICSVERHSLKAEMNVPLVFGDQRASLVQRNLIEMDCKAIRPMLTTLSMNGEIIAYLYGIVYDGAYHAYNMAFLPEYARLSPGKIVMHEAIVNGIENGYREFDFLRGSSYLKSRWTNRERKQYRFAIPDRKMISRIQGKLVFVLRPYLKSLLGSFYKPR